jgi:signal transduction histidine kinase
LTGGITSPAIIFFFIHVLMVTILLPGQSPYIYVVLAVGVVGVVAALENASALPHYTVIPGIPENLYTNLNYVQAQIVFFAVALFSTVFLTSSVMARLRERDRQIAALFQTAQYVSSTLDLPMVLDRLTSSAAQALNIPAASIRLLDKTGSKLTVAASYGLSQAYLDKGPVEPSHNPLAREVLSGKAVIVPDATAETRLQYPYKVIEEGIRSMLVVPLAGRSRSVGILRMYSYEPDHFTDEDAEFVMAIARQGAAAIENAMAHDALQKAEQQRAQFVRIVTHELRSPVTGSQSLLRVLLKNLAGELTEKQYDIIFRLDGRMNTLLELINDLLSLASSKAIDTQGHLESVELQPIIQAVVDKFRLQAEEKQVVVSTTLPDQSLSVQATEDGIARILDNLIGNAVKYTPTGGTVSVGVNEETSCMVIIVRDTGIGIPQESIARIGDEFYRAPNAKESGEIGTGLGMATVKQLINNFGGRVSIESAIGEGTTFTVTLPRAGTNRASCD